MPWKSADQANRFVAIGTSRSGRQQGQIIDVVQNQPAGGQYAGPAQDVVCVVEGAPMCS